MGKSPKYLKGAVAVVLAGAALQGCGSATVAVLKPEPGGPVQSGGAIARVGKTPIMKSAFESAVLVDMAGTPRAQRALPVPPDFTNCIDHLATAPVKPGTPRPTHAQLKAVCAGVLKVRAKEAMNFLISSEWMLGEAEERGVGVSDAEVTKKFHQITAAQYPTTAAYAKYAEKAGQNLANVLFTVKREMAEERLRKQIYATVGAVTPASVKAYYLAHQAQFAVKEQRDLGFIHVTSAALAHKVKAELQSGTSFAKVAKRYASQQPFYTKEGLLAGLEPHIFQEKPLDTALFAAAPHVVSGPVRLFYPADSHFRSRQDIQKINGYYIFTVEAIKPAFERTFKQVKSALKAQLPTLLRQQAVVGFVTAWRAKWRARTDCQAGYVIRKCRQFKPTPGEAPEDPYTLN